jgi:hypothetical protein
LIAAEGHDTDSINADPVTPSRTQGASAS